MTPDGSCAMSVGTDKFIRLWDLRAKSQISAIDATQYGDMNEIVFSPASFIDGDNSVQS
jgi:WD40 repeat protein